MSNIKVEVTSVDGGILHTTKKYLEHDIKIIPKLQDKTATDNGTVTPDDGYAGLKSVTVDVSGSDGPDLSQDTVTAAAMLEGTTAHDASGEQITGAIPTYVGEHPEIMRENDIMVLPTAGKYCEHDINIQPALQDKIVTQNGIVTADEGYVGLGSVSVDVPSSGGGDTPANIITASAKVITNSAIATAGSPSASLILS